MHWIFGFIVRHRNISSLVLTVVLSLLMISRTEQQQGRIVRALTLSVFYPFQFSINQVTRVKNIFAENRTLKQEVTRLSTKLALLEEKAAENERLRSLIGFGDQFKYELVPTRIVARDPSHEYRSVVINAGRDKKLSDYMPVVHRKGVVGKLIQVLPHISLVQLLKDPSNRISVMITRNRVVGILETENGRDFFVRYRSHEDVAAGDSVITSGLGGIFPKGLAVGSVEKIGDNHDPLFAIAHIDLFVDFDHIEEVFVMRLSPQWAAFQDEYDSLSFEE
jgi:rod shape-determining protein MreC